MGDVKDLDFMDTSQYKRSSKECRRIEFSDEWHARSSKEKIEYLIKLASSLNHAAVQIQKERDELSNTCFNIESQLIVSQQARMSDQVMIHTQLKNENEAKQLLLSENQQLRKEIKELEKKLKQKGE